VRVIGLDIGDRTVGVAVSDERGVLASGVCVLARRGDASDVAEVARVVARHGAGLVVAGLPRTLRGEVGPQARKVERFVADLRQAVPVPVETWDERLSTRMAERSLLEADVSRRRRRALVDQVAATVILQGYLDARAARAARGGQAPEPPAGGGREGGAPAGDTVHPEGRAGSGDGLRERG
jgi:putative Holliday junction resolvase